MRQSLSFQFQRDNIQAWIIGESCTLLFSVVTLIKAMPRLEGYPPLAATGKLDSKNLIKWVDNVPQKLMAALHAMPRGGMLFYPRENDNQVQCNAELIDEAKTKNAKLIPVGNLNEVAIYIGIKIRNPDVPYLDLRSFQYEHRAIYFGRQTEIISLYKKLSVREDSGTCLLIVAGSGVGKSSLVRAGLIPTLVEGPHALHNRPIVWADWRPSDCRAKTEAALAQSILGAWQKQENSKIYFDNFTEPKLLQELADQLANTFPAERRLFWLIDQFEEFFTTTAIYDADILITIETFLRNLQSLGVWIVATLRGDFYGHYLESPFKCFRKNSQFILEPLDSAALSDVINGPAELFNLSWGCDEKGISLAHHIRTDAGNNPNILPLLEFALRKIYAMSLDNKKMYYEDYKESGKLEGSIGRFAEDVFDELDNTVQESLRHLLWALTATSKTSEQNKIVARPICLSKFPNDKSIRLLINALTTNRLLIQDRRDKNDNAIEVRVTHEALLTHWERANKIIYEFSPDKQLYEVLKEQVKELPILPSGSLLNRSKALLEKMQYTDVFDRDVIDFVEKSIHAELAIKKKKKQSKFILIITSIIASIAIVLLTSVFINSYESANKIDVAGSWIYEVRNKNNQITHGGTGVIDISSGDSLVVYGLRVYQCDKLPDNKCNPNGKLIKLPKQIYWGVDKNDKSNFATRTTENKLIQFVYKIQKDGKTILAYCYLMPTENTDQHRPDELRGVYTTLTSAELLQGFVYFKRMNAQDAETEIENKIQHSQK